VPSPQQSGPCISAPSPKCACQSGSTTLIRGATSTSLSISTGTMTQTARLHSICDRRQRFITHQLTTSGTIANTVATSTYINSSNGVDGSGNRMPIFSNGIGIVVEHQPVLQVQPLAPILPRRQLPKPKALGHHTRPFVVRVQHVRLRGVGLVETQHHFTRQSRHLRRTRCPWRRRYFLWARSS
jgi:hypothetical protein